MVFIRAYLGLCRRADILDQLNEMPKDTMRFCIDLEAIDHLEGNERVRLRFTDGDFSDTDVGTACDRCNSEIWYVLTRWSAIT